MGEQDSAGSHVKNRVLMAIVRGDANITDAESMCNFLMENSSSLANRTQMLHSEAQNCSWLPTLTSVGRGNGYLRHLVKTEYCIVCILLTAAAL